MAIKIHILLLATVMLILSVAPVSYSHKICTLDHMRTIASRACEDVVERFGKVKRDTNSIESNYEHHKYVSLRHHEFPKYGYIKIRSVHAKALLEKGYWQYKKFDTELNARHKRHSRETNSVLQFCCKFSCENVKNDICNNLAHL